MPIYHYLCDKCGQPQEALSMSVKEGPPTLECCGQEMGRDYSTGKTHQAGYSKPILSDGLGVMPNQIAEARKLHPDREYTDDGRLVMRSHADRNRYLKEDGFHDNN
jgi:hypothetical protein